MSMKVVAKAPSEDSNVIGALGGGENGSWETPAARDQKHGDFDVPLPVNNAAGARLWRGFCFFQTHFQIPNKRA